MISEQKTKTAKVSKKPDYIEAVGRRREAVARVRFYQGMEKRTIQEVPLKTGDIVVNGKRIQEYFPGIVMQKAYMAPLRMTNTVSVYIISITTKGGGLQGQLEAAIHGMARILDTINTAEFRPLLKKKKLLTRDPRMKERLKAGFAQSARAKKQSPKR